MLDLNFPKGNLEIVTRALLLGWIRKVTLIKPQLKSTLAYTETPRGLPPFLNLALAWSFLIDHSVIFDSLKKYSLNMRQVLY